MKNTAISLLTTSAALAFTPLGAYAAEDNYVGAAIGARTHYGLDCGGGTVTCDRYANASGKIYFGKQLEKNFAAEVMAWRLGDGKGSVKNGSASVAGTVRSQGVAAVAVASTSLDAITIKARLGVGYARGSTDYAAGGSAAKSAFVPVMGIGASYAVDKSWSINADWDRLPARVNGGTRVNANMFSLGALYRF